MSIPTMISREEIAWQQFRQLREKSLGRGINLPIVGKRTIEIKHYEVIFEVLSIG
jgi:hypothetical protein